MKKRGIIPSNFHDFSDFGHSYPTEALYEFLNASADIDCPADVVGQCGEGELSGDLFFALAQEVAPVVIMLDGTEGMLAGLLAELLLGNVAFDEDHDAFFISLELAEVVVVIGLEYVGDLLEGIAGVAVHDDGDISTIVADVDMFFPLGIGTAIGAGPAGLSTGIFRSIPGVPLLE